MRTSRSILCTILFLLFTTFTAAWPWPRWLPELDTIVARQNDQGSEPSASQTTVTATSTRESDSKITDAPTSTDDVASTDDPTTTNTRGGTTKVIGSASTRTSGTGSKTASGGKSRTTSYDARLPAGGVAMITPAVTLGEQYYKIGDHVTFAWNYTSLLATPSAVNIMATCTANEQLYTLAMNQTITNSTMSVVWDTGDYQATAVSDPLLTETYTLIIYDAESSISATAQAGYLAVYDQYTFGMYTPQPYVPWSEYTCATCSGALSDMERKALGMVVGMSVLTVLSFTWFVGGTGVIW